MVFCRACGFLSGLWFFVGLVVFCLACGFWASLWFFSSLWFFVGLVVFCLACGFCRACGFLGELVVFFELVVFGRVVSCLPPTHTTEPISPRIDENALEGVYFAFSLIIRCLPYFCRKTRARASYDLLRAHSGVLAAVGLQGIARSALRVRNGKSRQKPRASASFRRYYQRGVS